MTLSKSLSHQALGFLICQWGGQDPLVSMLLWLRAHVCSTSALCAVVWGPADGLALCCPVPGGLPGSGQWLWVGRGLIVALLI